MITLGSNQHMKKKFYKNNVGCIIFMVTVYLRDVRESCLTYEKILNKCRKIYECDERLAEYGRKKGKICVLQRKKR